MVMGDFVDFTPKLPPKMCKIRGIFFLVMGDKINDVRSGGIGESKFI